MPPFSLRLLPGARVHGLRPIIFCLCVCLAASALAVFGPARSTATDASTSSSPDAHAGDAPADARATARALEAYGRLPLRFEANRGQTGGAVKFISRGGGYTLFMANDGAVLRLRGGAEGAESVSTLKLKLEGARKASRVEGVGRLPGLSNYFLGGRRAWRTNVPAYEKVRYSSVYPGVDLVYYGNQGRLEYDFHLDAGADPRRVRLRFDGATSVRLDGQGELVVGTEAGDVRQLKPIAYQEVGGARREIAAGYVVDKDGRVGFDLGDYDESLPLVIDPVLVYSTYLGGTGTEQGLAVAVDATGAAYVAGSTTSLDFPGPSPVQNANGGFSDAFVLKLNPAGSALVYATYLGGSGDDRASAVTADAQGNAYVAGFTGSGGFPRTPGAWQDSKDGVVDAFLTKLNAAGSAIVYSTFVGGPNSEEIFGVKVDAAGRAHVAGRTDSPSFRALPPDQRGGDPVQRSTNAAASWSPSDAGLSASSVSAFAFDPSNPDTIYAATSAGVFRSTNAGGNWQLTGTARASTAPIFTTSVVVDPTNPAVIYAGAINGVFKSTDGGVLYEQKNSGLFSTNISALVVNPSTPTTLYAGTLFGVFKSTNGGDTWAEVKNGITTGTSPRVNELVLDPSNPATVYAGTTRGVFKTTDGGANWAPINNGFTSPGFAVQIQALAIDPLNPSTLYASTLAPDPNVFKTTDGGANWAVSGNGITFGGLIPIPTVNAFAVSPASPSTVYAGTVSGGVFKTTDGGANWFASGAGLTSKTIFALAVAPNNAANLYAGALAGGDAFVMRFNASGSFPEYFRFIGGSENEDARGLALDPAGNAYVVGLTNSDDFPVVNALQSTLGGFADAFVTKLDAAGNTSYATYLGGAFTDQGRAIDVNAAGNAFVTGATGSDDFPVVNALQPARAGFGFDAFVAKLHPSGSSLVYSTYLGGESAEDGLGIAVDSAGSAYVAGTTQSGTSFPVVNAPQPTFGGSVDAFLTKLNPAGSALTYSTFLGGSAVEAVGGLALDAAGGAYVVGTTPSFNFPLASPLKSSVGGPNDAFITRIRQDADLSITKADSRDPVMVNNQLTYTLTVSNAGPEEAAQVVVTDTLPAGVNFVSATAGQGSCNGTANVTCQLGDLPADASVAVHITVTPTAQGTLVNTANVSSATPDRDVSNNTVTQQTRVAVLPSIAGRVTRGGGGSAGLAGVTVTLGGAQAATTTTDANGFYEFPDLAAGGNYHVTPARAGFVFHPQSRSFTNLTADATADFNSVECVFQISPSVGAFNASGGVGVVSVSAPDALCPRTALSNAPWVTVTSGAAGNGTGVVTFSVAPTSASRRATLNIAGRLFTVFQELSPCDGPSFTAARLVPGVPGGKQSLRGDFNNDGRPDLALAGDTNIFILLNDGAGGFTLTDTKPGGGFNFHGLTLGDFNADGKLDVVSVSNAGGGFNGSVGLRLGDGAGHLGAVTSFGVGVNPTSADVADFNNDGRPDLAVANSESDNVSVLLGDGAGSFAAARTTAAGGFPQPEHVAAGDYNKDGKADVAVLGAFGVNVLLGDGNGNLGPHTVFPSGVFETSSLTAGDLNGDGNLDLVATGNNLTLLVGNGAGGFAAPRFLINGTGAPSVSVADVNADGRRDIVAAADFSNVLVLLGTGAGEFAAPVLYQAGRGVRAVAVADFDGDGVSDIAATGGDIFGFSGNGGSTHLLKGSGGGAFAAARSFRFTNVNSILRTQVGRFNADAHPDLVVGTNFGVYFVPGTGTGTLADATPVSTGESTTPLTALDFNRDGKLDFAALVVESGSPSRSRLRVFAGDGAGSFTVASDTTFEIFNTLAVFGDFNRDGNPDAVSPLGAGDLSLRLGNGAGGFNAPTTISLPGSQFEVVNRLLAGDFDGDGNLDLLTPLPFGAGGSCDFGGFTVRFLRGNGAGGFAAPAEFPFDATVINWLAHDFNNDGRDDLAVLNGCNRKAVVMLSNPEGGFTTSGASPTLGEEPRLLDLGDFNGDGRPDLVTGGANRSDLPNFVTVVNGDGAGGLTTAATIDAGGGPPSLSVGDFDGNGRDDLAVTHAFSNVALFLNSCPVTQPSSAVKFNAQAVSADEGDGSLTVTVTREGATNGSAAVGYSTLNGSASDRADYTYAEGVLNFAPGETSKTFDVLITDDAHVEGPETLTLFLSAPAGVALGAPNNVVLTITDNDAAPTSQNPSDNSSFFVRQHYRDFLGRDPDAPGLAHWTNEIESCGTDQQCREVRRINVSAAFFLSIEFQETGYLAYRAYKAAYGDTTSPNVEGTVPVIRLREFLADAGRIGRGVQVGVGDWFRQLEDNKAAFVLDFVTRPRFTAAYPSTMSAAEFVTKLDARAGNVLSPEERAELVAILGPAPADSQRRAQVLRRVAEDADLRQRETNRAFVLMQYFGYMRRNPDDPQDSDFRGWKFWLDKLEEHHGNFVNAEMVKAFIISIEYRQRFGQ